MSTRYALGEHAAVRSVLDRVHGFAGAPDVHSHSTNGWLSLVPAPAGTISVVAARDGLAVSVGLDGSAVSGDPPPAELLVPAEWLARVAKLADALARPLDVDYDASAGRATLAGIASVQTCTDRPGPKVFSGGSTEIATLDTAVLVAALKRAKIAAAGRVGDTSNPLGGYSAVMVGDDGVHVASTDSYVAFAERVAVTPGPSLQMLVAGALAHSLLANLSPYLGDKVHLAVDDPDHPVRLLLSGDGPAGSAPAPAMEIGVYSAAYPAPGMFTAVLGSQAQTPAIFADQRPLGVWLKALCGAGTQVRLAATPAGGQMASTGDTPRGHVAREELVLPAGITTSRGIAEATCSTDLLRRAVNALAGVSPDPADGDDADLEPGTLVLALAPFPGGRAPTLGVHVTNVGMPDAAVYTAGLRPGPAATGAGAAKVPAVPAAV